MLLRRRKEITQSNFFFFLIPHASHSLITIHQVCKGHRECVHHPLSQEEPEHNGIKNLHF